MKNAYFPNDDEMIVRGRRVRVPKWHINKKGDRDGLEPSYGFKKRVMTPWGVVEECIITPVPSLAGGFDFCAQVERPKSNPYVKMSTFWIDDL
jgi:hypothetical protein